MSTQAYSIISITEATGLNSTGGVVRTKQVKYMVGNDGPFTYVAPWDQQAAEQITAALVALAAGVVAIREAQ